MDALIVLFVIGAFILSLTKKAKQPKKRDFDPEKTKPTQPAQTQKIPYTKEEWNEYLRAQGVAQKKSAPHKPQPVPTAQAASVQEDSAHDARLRPSAPPAGSREMVERMHRAVEHGMTGSVTAQGESEAEHAEHLHRMYEDDLRARTQNDTLQELRRMNRARLRQAVIMREILDRPISMRGE
jgi:hypothetical protein